MSATCSTGPVNEPGAAVPLAPPPVRRAEVERHGPDLVVTWEGGPVSVYVSESPDRRGVPVAEGTGGRAEVSGLDLHTRYFVHLVAGDDAGEAVVVAAERRITLEGALNFRDLGGYVGRDGRRVRWGRVFRSDHLGELVESDLYRLDRLGVQVVVDLRGEHEHQAMPSRIAGDGRIRRLDLPVLDGPAAGGTFYDHVMSGRLKEFRHEDVTDFYLLTLERSAAVFGEVLGVAADPDQHAVVFHCTAGKDRTGLTAALLLSVLGVADEVILDDYELTNRYRVGRRMEILRPQLAEAGIDIDRFKPLFYAPRGAMAETLRQLRQRYGSVERYLLERAAVDRATIEDLRRHLLD